MDDQQVDKGPPVLGALHEQVFTILEKKLIVALILIIPNSGEDYHVYTDASL